MDKKLLLMAILVVVLAAIALIVAITPGKEKAVTPPVTGAPVGAQCGDGVCSTGEACPADCAAPCTDSDGGNDTSVAGFVRGIDRDLGTLTETSDYCALADEVGNIQMVDSCSNSDPNCRLFELNCAPGSPYVSASAVVCPTGCNAGVCVAAPCTDSDGGNHTEIWGVAAGIDPETGNQLNASDYCALADEVGNIGVVTSCSNSDPDCKLFEMNCATGSPYLAPTAIRCPNGCDRGICV